MCAERAPEAVKAIADGGHEVLSHSYAMDVVPALLSDEDEKANIERCTRLLEQASGQKIQGWLSPRGTSKLTTPKLLADRGYRWYGDVFDADLPYVQTCGDKKIVAIPLSYDVNDMPSMKYGVPPQRMLETFEDVLERITKHEQGPAIVDATDAARLDLALGRPVLVVEATDVDTQGKPLLTKRSRFSAERVEFLVENG